MHRDEIVMERPNQLKLEGRDTNQTKNIQNINNQISTR